MLIKKYIAILSVLLIAAAVFSCYPTIKEHEIVKRISSGLDFIFVDKKTANAEETQPETEAPVTTEEVTTQEVTTEEITTENTTAVPETTVAQTTVPVTTAPPATQPPQTQPPVTTAPPVTEPATEYVPPAPVTPTEFDNSLFIGDSRTVGLYYFGNLGNADVFATKGMNVFRVFSDTISVRSCGETKLEPLLASKKYDRVYIMLGINEIGSDIERGIKPKYTDLVNKVREKQPDATIYLCANLHITYSRSQSDEVYNNTRLNAINNIAASLCNGNTVKYIDVNSIFDDSTNSLGAAYCTDDFHPMPKYYKQWSDWLATVT